MTNKEKIEYINHNLRKNMPIARNSFILNKTDITPPLTLFKYRKFDKYAFEMLDEDYIYFCPAKELDDPYECSGYLEVKKPTEGYYKKIMEYSMNRMLKKMPWIQEETVNQIKEIFRKSFNKDHIDREKLFLNTPNEFFINHEKRTALNVLENVEARTNEFANSEAIEKFIKTSIQGPDKVGIFALSEENNNRIMWSLYSNKYKGYCIEYDFSGSDYLNILYPVLYLKKYTNNIFKDTIDFNLDLVIEMANPLQRADYSLPLRQYCRKDISWKAQKEWRLIWNPGEKTPAPKIKAIYLGFKVSKRNLSKMKSYAKGKFDLYLMEINANKNKLYFKKIDLN